MNTDTISVKPVDWYVFNALFTYVLLSWN